MLSRGPSKFDIYDFDFLPPQEACEECSNNQTCCPEAVEISGANKCRVRCKTSLSKDVGSGIVGGHQNRSSSSVGKGNSCHTGEHFGKVRNYMGMFRKMKGNTSDFWSKQKGSLKDKSKGLSGKGKGLGKEILKKWKCPDLKIPEGISPSTFKRSCCLVS